MSESKHTSDQLIGCGDHSCLFVRPQGLGTNGGCRCAREPGRLAHNVRVLHQQRDELLQAAKAALHYMRLHKYADQAWADDLERAIAKAEGRSDE